MEYVRDSCAVSVSYTRWWRLKLASASRKAILPSPLRTAAARLPAHPSRLWRSSSLQTSSECPLHRDSPSRQNLETRLQSSAQAKVGNKVKLRHTMIVFFFYTVHWLTDPGKQVQCTAHARKRGDTWLISRSAKLLFKGQENVTAVRSSIWSQSPSPSQPNDKIRTNNYLLCRTLLQLLAEAKTHTNKQCKCLHERCLNMPVVPWILRQGQCWTLHVNDESSISEKQSSVCCGKDLSYQ